jgi:dTDP-4-dehydrorhamnose reductase
VTARKRVLITGATGMLGSVLVGALQEELDVYSTSSSVVGLGYFNKYLSFALENGDYSHLIEWADPDVIIHCGALTNGNYCENHPLNALEVNGLSLKKLADSSKAHIIYISTDAVFANSKHMAKEADFTFPESVYGKSKELGEFFLTHSGIKHTIIRTTIVGFNNKPGKVGFVEWIVNSALNGVEINLFNDVLFTPISCAALAVEIESIVKSSDDRDLGVLHIGGSEIVTKYQFGLALLERLGLPSSLVNKGSILSFGDRAKRSTDQTLDSSNYESLHATKLPGLKKTIDDLVQSFYEK